MIFKVKNPVTKHINVLKGMKALEEFLQMRQDQDLPNRNLEFYNRKNELFGAEIKQWTSSEYIVKWPVNGNCKEKFVFVDGVLA